MVYCVRCGTQNVDSARFCNSCGNTLGAAPQTRWKPEEECQDECAKGPKSGSLIWGIIIILIGLWIIFELGLRNIQGLPQWLQDFQFWWIFPVLLGIVILFLGLRMIVRR